MAQTAYEADPQQQDVWMEEAGGCLTRVDRAVDLAEDARANHKLFGEPLCHRARRDCVR